METRVLVTAIKNPFDPHNSRTIKMVEHRPDSRVRHYVSDFYPLVSEDFRICMTVNGKLLNDEGVRDYVVRPGDSIVFAPMPEDSGGGGGGGKGILGAVMMIAVVALAVWTGGLASAAIFSEADMAAAIAEGSLEAMNAAATMSMVATGVGWAVTGAVMIAGGMLVNAIMPQGGMNPDFGMSSGSSIGGSFAKSQTYSWDVASNQLKNGSGIPVIYGTVQITPPIIARYVSTNGDSQYLNMLMCLSDSPVDVVEKININDTAIGYYASISSDIRYGADNQSPMSNFSRVYTDYSVSAKLSGGSYQTIERDPNSNAVVVGPDGSPIYDSSSASSNWVTVSTQGDQTTGIGVGIAIAGLYYANDQGGLDEQTVTVDVQYRMNGGGWTDMGSYSVTRADSGTIRQYWEVSGLPAGQYDVRAMRTAGPPELSRYSGTTRLDYVQTIIEDSLSYPGLSLLGINALATDQLSGGQPTVTALVTRKTVDVFDGMNWVKKSACNPAWVCWDIIANSYYGGQIDPSRVIYSDFASWADYCDSKGIECNLYFDSDMSVIQALNNVSSLGRAIVVQKGTSFSAIVDRPMEPVQLFNVANICSDTFVETFLETKDRANVIEVTYFDADRDYTRQIVEIRDISYNTTQTALNRSQVTLYGCTDRQQAIQQGKFLLNCNKYLLRTVNFDANIDSIGCMVGDIIWVQHDLTEWGYGGRLLEAGTRSIILDRQVLVEPGKSYRILVRHQDDDSIEEQPLFTETTQPYSTDTFNLVNNWEHIPVKDAVYSFGEENKEAKRFRVLALTRSQELRRKITAIEYYDEIYDDTHVIADLPNFTNLAAVKGLLAVEVWKAQLDGTGQSVVSCTWAGQSMAWNVYTREHDKGLGWSIMGTTTAPKYDIYGLQPGKTYEVCVSESDPSSGSIVTVSLQGKDAPPSDVYGFFAWQHEKDIDMKWLHIPDMDLLCYEVRVGTTWEKGKPIVEGIKQNTASWTPPVSGTYSLWIKAIDRSKNYSTHATNFQVSVNVDQYINIVSDINELTKATPADGTKTNLAYLPSRQVMALVSSLTDTDVTTLTNTGMATYAGDKFLQCTYVTNEKDFGRNCAFTLRMVSAVDSNIRHATDMSILARTDQSYALDTDTHITSNSSYTTSYRVRADGGSYGNWVDFPGVATCYGRYYQVRFIGNVDTFSTYFEFDTVRHIADVPEIRKTVKNVAVPSAGLTVLLSTYNFQVFVDYMAGIQVLGGIPLFPNVTKLSDRFTIQLFDKLGNVAAGNVDINFVGF